MPTFKYTKLVRDKIRQIHEDNGDVVTGKTLSRRELSEALQQKLTEENTELFEAIAIHNTTNIENELADIYQVLEDLAFALEVSETNIQTAKKHKYSEKGGFKDGIYIDTVTIVHEDDPLLPGFRDNPDKYPEIR